MHGDRYWQVGVQAIYAPRFAARLKTAVLKQDIWLEVAMEVGIMWNRLCTLGDFLFEVPIEMPMGKGRFGGLALSTCMVFMGVGGYALPEGFLGRSAPRLRYCYLCGIEFPGIWDTL